MGHPILPAFAQVYTNLLICAFYLFHFSVHESKMSRQVSWRPRADLNGSEPRVTDPCCKGFSEATRYPNPRNRKLRTRYVPSVECIPSIVYGD
jgi:hypothetical protein